MVIEHLVYARWDPGAPAINDLCLALGGTRSLEGWGVLLLCSAPRGSGKEEHTPGMVGECATAGLTPVWPGPGVCSLRSEGKDTERPG